MILSSLETNEKTPLKIGQFNAPKRIHESFEPTIGIKHFLKFYHLQKLTQFEKNMFQMAYSYGRAQGKEKGWFNHQLSGLIFSEHVIFREGYLFVLILFFLLRSKWSRKVGGHFTRRRCLVFPVGMIRDIA